MPRRVDRPNELAKPHSRASLTSLRASSPRVAIAALYSVGQAGHMRTAGGHECRCQPLKISTQAARTFDKSVDVEQQREQLQVDQVASTVVVTAAVKRVGAGVDLLCDLVAQRQALDRSVRFASDRAVLRWRDAVVFVARAAPRRGSAR